MDSVYKVVNPSTYSCKLCELTYGSFQEKKAWKEFREDLDFETEFLHKDEFQEIYASKFGHKFEFPIVLTQTKNGLEVLVSSKKFSEIDSISEFISLLYKLV